MTRIRCTRMRLRDLRKLQHVAHTQKDKENETTILIRGSLIYFLAFNELANFLLCAFSFAIPFLLLSVRHLSPSSSRSRSPGQSPTWPSHLLRGSQSRALEVRAGERASKRASGVVGHKIYKSGGLEGYDSLLYALITARGNELCLTVTW